MSMTVLLWEAETRPLGVAGHHLSTVGDPVSKKKTKAGDPMFSVISECMHMV